MLIPKIRRPRAGIALAASVAMLCTVSAATAAEFFQSIDDLPMAPAMTEVPAESVAFDSPAGRIATAVGRIDATAEAVRAFYQSALPPLGWVRIREDTFRREGELLTISAEPGDGGLKVRIRVVPADTNNPR